MFKKFKRYAIQNEGSSRGKMLSFYGKEAEKHLIEGEILWSVYALHSDFFCITNHRIFFVDKDKKGTKKLISLTFRHISEITCDYRTTFQSELIISSGYKSYCLRIEHELGERMLKDITKHMMRYEKEVRKI